MNMNHKQQHIHTAEQGLVSIIVVMILMGILVLISTSFALLMRREQRQVLDRQLSTQAFYAAESGINDVAAKINSINNVTSCAGTGSNLDTANNVGYTCVLVNKNPDSVVYDPVSTDTSTIVRLQSESGLPITRIDLSWEDDSNSGVGNKFVPTSNNDFLLPQAGVTDPETDNLTASDGTGILRATIMPVPNTASTTQGALTAAAKTYVLYPRVDSSLASPNEFSSADGVNENARFLDGKCNTGSTPYYCNARITNLGGTNSGVVYLRLKSIYKATAVTVKIYNGSPGTPTNIINAQAVIDSTGRAADVLRRIQVRIPIKGSYLYPEFAIDSLDTICKITSFPQNGATPIISMPQEDSSPYSTPQIFYDSSKDATVCNPAAR
jgi:Tfp pilus assembly protein PilX